MTPRRPVIRVALLGAAAGVLAACSHMGGSMGGMMPRPSQVVALTATLNGAQEVPPNDKAGTGQAEVTFNKDTLALTYRITYAGLSGPATGAHIHGPAAATANAPVVVPFASPGSPIAGETRLNATQAGDLLAGLYYVNVHTAAHPGGEIRGQLKLKP